MAIKCFLTLKLLFSLSLLKCLVFSGCHKSSVCAPPLKPRVMPLSSRTGFKRLGWIWPWWTTRTKPISSNHCLPGRSRYKTATEAQISALKICLSVARLGERSCWASHLMSFYCNLKFCSSFVKQLIWPGSLSRWTCDSADCVTSVCCGLLRFCWQQPSTKFINIHKDLLSFRFKVFFGWAATSKPPFFL